MRLHFLGAAGEVTGSSYLLETRRGRVLIDFGMFQGRKATLEQNARVGNIRAAEIDSVLLTHAHLDHCGRLPLLFKNGFKGRVYGTHATRDVAQLILNDSAHIQTFDADRRNKYRKRAGRSLIAPLYQPRDVDPVMKRFKNVELGDYRVVAPGMKARFFEAGHILGSTSIELVAEEDDGSQRTIVFSGDIGRDNMPLLCDPDPPPKADFVVMESTYGDREHRSIRATEQELKRTLRDARKAGARILIPAFSVGRTQLLLYYLAQLQAEDNLNIPVFLDSPMAIKATELYVKHMDTLDDEVQSYVNGKSVRSFLARVNATPTVEQSKSIASAPDPCIIIAGSGMCDGGRIMHHLRHNLYKDSTLLVVMGFMAAGTIGRRLVDGAERVKIHGQEIEVNARVVTLGGFSGHAGQSELMKWAKGLAEQNAKFILTHGEDSQRKGLREKLRSTYGVNAHCPYTGESIDVLARFRAKGPKMIAAPTPAPTEQPSDSAPSTSAATSTSEQRFQDYWKKGGGPDFSRLKRVPIDAEEHERQFLSEPLTAKSAAPIIKEVANELKAGVQMLHDVKPCVTVFGSARFPASHRYYHLARDVGRELAQAGYAVLTGGGPGVMEAANRGARDVGGRSLGCNIELPHEQHANPYVDEVIEFKYFFTRKVMLIRYSEAFVVLPGGFGTMDELYEAATLLQCRKIGPFPLVLVGRDFWQGIVDYTRFMLNQGVISREDLYFTRLTDSPKEAVDIINRGLQVDA